MRLSFVLLLAGCRRKAPPPAAGEQALAVASAAAPAALEFAPDAEIKVGVPRGCTMVERPVAAEAGAEVLFFAPDEPRDELALLVPGAGLRAGVVGLKGGAVRPLWAVDAERPPALAAGGRGWLAYASVAPAAAGEAGQALLLREGSERVERWLSGDGVEAVDLRCRGGHCAALSTRAARVAAAGATVLLGAADAPASGWQRVDYAPEGTEAERPLVVAAVGPGRATVAMAGERGVRFVEAQAGGARRGVFVEAPHGALEAIQLRRAVVVGHGARRAGDCAEPRPSVLVAREGAEPQLIAAEAPALAAFARPIARGAFVAWLSPSYCGDRRRRVAHAALLDEEGALRSGPMAVADATGLGLATAGERVELWLRRGGRVVWLRLRCD